MFYKNILSICLGTFWWCLRTFWWTFQAKISFLPRPFFYISSLNKSFLKLFNPSTSIIIASKHCNLFCVAHSIQEERIEGLYKKQNDKKYKFSIFRWVSYMTWESLSMFNFNYYTCCRKVLATLTKLYLLHIKKLILLNFQRVILTNSNSHLH